MWCLGEYSRLNYQSAGSLEVCLYAPEHDYQAMLMPVIQLPPGWDLEGQHGAQLVPHRVEQMKEELLGSIPAALAHQVQP
mmetsp:Transcript_18439/g.39629  ORF Transcript_18439/g.39629 Transcript_18439/m.39629 type:complete len:80 (-) Transcript_18439:651-890(-)